jgi:peroxiredoxin
VFCRERVAQLRDHRTEIDAAGVGLAAIGTGDIEYARHFKAQRSIDFPLLVDDELRSYREIGAGWLSWRQLVSLPGTLLPGARLLARGRLQGRSGRSPLLLGATHLIKPDGSVPYAWVNASLSDEAPLPEVLAAVAQARPAGS